MPSGRDAAQALGSLHALKKGSKPRVRRYGTREWVDAPVGTQLYGGDEIDMRRGSGSIRYSDGSTSAVREGSFTRMTRPQIKAEKKKRKIESGEAHLGRE